MPSRRRVPSAPSGFEIWQVGNRIQSIDNPVRLAILQALAQAPQTLGGLGQATRRSKATLSGFHMKELIESGLVDSVTDPHDARVKWFKLAGKRLGSSNVSVPDLKEAVLGYVRGRGLVPLRPVLEIIQPRLMAQHADDAYIDAVARSFGQLVGRTIPATGQKERRQAVADLLGANGLGSIRWSGARMDVDTEPALERFVRAAAESAVVPPGI